MQAVCLEPGVFPRLVEPVDLDTGRADDEEPALAPSGQVGDHGQPLNRLPKTHLVTEDRALLVDRVLGAEHLVSAEGHGQQRGVEGDRVDLLAQFLRDESSRRLFLVRPPRTADRGQDCVDRRRVAQVVLPQLVRLIGVGIGGDLGVTHLVIQLRYARVGKNRFELSEGLVRCVPLAGAAEEHAHPAAGWLSLLDQRGCLVHEHPQRLIQRSRDLLGRAKRGERRQQSGLSGIRAIRIESERSVVPHPPLRRSSGCHHLLDCPRTHAGHSVKDVRTARSSRSPTVR